MFHVFDVSFVFVCNIPISDADESGTINPIFVDEYESKIIATDLYGKHCSDPRSVGIKQNSKFRIVNF